MYSFGVRTDRRTQMVDITREVQRAVEESGVSEGICVIYVPHTTAGVTINENADPSVVADILEYLERLVPRSSSFRHREGNADAHIKASLIGPSQAVLVRGGRLSLGTWQGIFFCEFDGPRSRNVFLQVVGEKA
jgi:secondary thiamine-phosphate synthase enzyme